MSKHFFDIAASIIEHGLVRKGRAKPSRVWHLDEETGKRTLLVDNSKDSSEVENEHEKFPENLILKYNKM